MGWICDGCAGAGIGAGSVDSRDRVAGGWWALGGASRLSRCAGRRGGNGVEALCAIACAMIAAEGVAHGVSKGAIVERHAPAAARVSANNPLRAAPRRAKSFGVEPITVHCRPIAATARRGDRSQERFKLLVGDSGANFGWPASGRAPLCRRAFRRVLRRGCQRPFRVGRFCRRAIASWPHSSPSAS